MNSLRSWWRSMTAAERRRWVFVELLGLTLLFFTMRVTFFHIFDGVNFYDEGIVLTDANLLLLKQVPYRDFYSNYPPGVFLILAGLFKVFGVHVFVERVFGFFVHLTLRLAAGRLIGRLTGTPMSLLGAGIVGTWVVSLNTVPSAWVTALAAAFCAMEVTALALSRGPRMWVLAGFSTGAVSWFRHDMFLYWAVWFGLVACLYLAFLWLARNDRTLLRKVLYFAGGTALALLVFWGPVLALGGVSQTWHDLYYDQVHYVLPARRLPLPGDFNDTRYISAIALALTSPVIALLAFVLSRFVPMKSPLSLAMVGTLGAGVMPQMLGRTDGTHVFYTVAPGVVLVTMWAIAALPRDSWVVLGLLLWPVRGDIDQGPPGWHQPTYPEMLRSGGLPDSETDSRRQVLAYIAQETQPGEGIYVGCFDHGQIFISEVDLYFLADRPGATRYMQFDPNVVNREDVQQQMIRELERAPTRVLVLSARGNHSNEPNDSSKRGAETLDQYIRTHYELALQVGPYMVMKRK